MLKHFIDEYTRYKLIGEKALAQVSEEEINHTLSSDNNSIAIIVRHISGNLISRFTGFLTSDGEKVWRNRDSEFEQRSYSRSEVEQHWQEGWRVLENTLAELQNTDLTTQVYIRGQALSVHEALMRSVAHIAYHVGLIVLLARILKEGNWQWISIPPGQSNQYNQNPTMEKRPQ